MADGGHLARADEFIWTDARLLERQLFSHLFAGGGRDAVVSAVLAYQNPDGGFGNALEPDMRCPDSQPVSTEFAMRLLDRVGGLAEATALNVCDFLAGISGPEGGLPTALPSVTAYPAAPWWTELAQASHSLNPTAALAGLLAGVAADHAWVHRATAYCWDQLATTETTEFHDLMPAITFLERLSDDVRAERALKRIGDRILAAGVVAFDSDAPGYLKGPLDWAPTPQSYCRRLFADDVITAQLAALAARQQPDGGWPINWRALSAGCEAAWRGIVTVEALSTLQAYGALAT